MLGPSLLFGKKSFTCLAYFISELGDSRLNLRLKTGNQGSDTYRWGLYISNIRNKKDVFIAKTLYGGSIITNKR